MSEDKRVTMSVADLIQDNVYIGTKTVKAYPMTKAEYCKYRGWDIPEGEDPNEALYLVEYEKDPKSKKNHPDHEGYITMSPKHVFDKAYRKAGTYMDRLLIERADLNEKIVKLSTAIDNKKVPSDQEDVLNKQLRAMMSYIAILDSRIK